MKSNEFNLVYEFLGPMVDGYEIFISQMTMNHLLFT